MSQSTPIDKQDHPPCVRLPWDTEFFELPVARVQSATLDRRRAKALRDWITASAVECVYFLNEPTDAVSIAAAQDVGFQEMDERVELGLQLEAPQVATAVAFPENIAPAARSEESALADMARELHVDSRFFQDPGFPDDKARELYARWIQNSLRAPEQQVLVGHVDGRAAGYVACVLEPDATGRIGLIGVAENAQGAGLGSALVQASIAWFQNHGARRVLVVTQGRNEAALRLYQRAGFQPATRGTWLHFWASKTTD